MTDPAPHWYVDRSVPDHAVVTVAGKPSVRRYLIGSATGQLPTFAQRQVEVHGVRVPLLVAGGFAVALFGGMVAGGVQTFPFSLIAAVFAFGLVVVGHRASDALSARRATPGLVDGDQSLRKYAQMAKKEVQRREMERREDTAAARGVPRYDPDLCFPGRTVWAMRESGNGVAQFVARRLSQNQFEFGGEEGVEKAFHRYHYEAWQACVEACGSSSVGVLEVEGSGHAVFGGALQALPDGDLLALAPLVVERHEVEDELAVLTEKIERAKATGANNDYPEVAGAVAEAEALREQVSRLEDLYQERLTVAQNEAALAELTEREKWKADQQESALRDLSDPSRDD